MPKEKMQTPGMEMGGEKTEKSKDARILAAIGYLWILCLLPLLGKRQSEFAQFHGKQGLAYHYFIYCLACGLGPAYRMDCRIFWHYWTFSTGCLGNSKCHAREVLGNAGTGEVR